MIVYVIQGRLSYRSLHHYINQTSMGRTATQLMAPDVVSSTTSTKQWSIATKDMQLIVPAPRERKEGKQDPAEHSTSTETQTNTFPQTEILLQKPDHRSVDGNTVTTYEYPAGNVGQMPVSPQYPGQAVDQHGRPIPYNYPRP